MRVRPRDRGELTGEQRLSAVRSTTLRVRHLATEAGQRTYAGYRSAKTKATAAGQLDLDDQVRYIAGDTARNQTTRLVSRRLDGRTGRALNRTSRAMGPLRNLREAGDSDASHLAAQGADVTWRQVRNKTAKLAAKTGLHATMTAGKGVVKAAPVAARGTTDAIAVAGKVAWVSGRAGARLTVRATRAGRRITRRVARRAAAGRSAAVAKGAVQRAAAAATTTARAVAAAVRASVVALVGAVSGSGVVPSVVGILAVVLLLVSTLPGFITGGGRQAQQASSVAGACENKTYELGPVKPHVQAAAELLGSMFGVETIGGWRAGNTYDYEGHPAGLALDIMVPVNPAGRAKGQQIADYVQAHAADLGVKYQIWYQQIWSVERSGEGWRAMADRGSTSANHLDHVHVSFNETAGVGRLDQLLAQACGTDVTNTGPTVAGDWAAPIGNLRVSSAYGMRIHPVTGIYKLHSGTDYPAGGCGAPIYAAAAGTVTITTPAWSGALVTIDHGGGVVTRYGHMYRTDVIVNTGDRVVAGQRIGAMGNNGYSTGCHLHFEVMINGDFVNPANYLNQKGIR